MPPRCDWVSSRPALSRNRISPSCKDGDQPGKDARRLTLSQGRSLVFESPYPDVEIPDVSVYEYPVSYTHLTLPTILLV